MNFIHLIESEEFGVSIAIIAVIVAVTETLLKKFKNTPQFLVNYLPLLVALIGTIVKDIILSGRVVVTEDVLYVGLMSYSLGTILSVSVQKILSGEKADDALFMLVKGITERICRENSKAEINKIVGIVLNAKDENTVSVVNEIVAVLDGVKKDDVSLSEITAVAESILLSAQKLKKEK